MEHVQDIVATLWLYGFKKNMSATKKITCQLQYYPSYWNIITLWSHILDENMVSVLKPNFKLMSLHLGKKKN